VGFVEFGGCEPFLGGTNLATDPPPAVRLFRKLEEAHKWRRLISIFHLCEPLFRYDLRLRASMNLDLPRQEYPSQFWNALAPHHALIEDNYFDLRSARRLMPHLLDPVLIVGAGQGLIVQALLEAGLSCDGVDLSSEMIRHAKLRRGLDLIEANACAMPFPDRKFGTVIYATGVIDFIEDEREIRAILNEGRRVLNDSGKMFVAFYRLGPIMEDFLKRTALLAGNMLAQRQSLQLYLLNPVQFVRWVARSARVGYVRALCLLGRVSAFSTMREKTMSLRMRKLFRQMDDPHSLIEASPEKQPYRNECEIQNLFKHLALQVKRVEASDSCFVWQILP
jgi:hypothetical protein